MRTKVILLIIIISLPFIQVNLVNANNETVVKKYSEVPTLRNVLSEEEKNPVITTSTSKKLAVDLPIYKSGEQLLFQFTETISNTTEELFLDFFLNDSRSVPILNSTRDLGVIEIELVHDTHYTLVHKYYEDIPLFFSEVDARGYHDGTLIINISITLPDPSIHLGHWYFWFELTNQADNILEEENYSFLVSDDYLFNHQDTFLYYNNQWTNMSALNLSTVSPGDEVVVYGELLRQANNKTIARSSQVSNHTTTITMGSRSFTVNVSTVNTSSNQELGLSNSNYLFVIPFTVPSIDFIGNIRLEMSLKIVLSFDENNTVNDSFTVTCPLFYLDCDYKVVSSTLEIIEEVFCLGDKLHVVVLFEAVKVYNYSSVIEKQFVIPDIQLQLFFFNTSHKITKSFDYEREGNTLLVNIYGFGSYPFEKNKYPAGTYIIETYWKKTLEPTFNKTKSTEHFSIHLLTNEQFAFFTRTDQGLTNTITLKILRSQPEVTLGVDIYFINSGGFTYASTSRAFQVGLNTSSKVSPSFSYRHEFSFSKEFAQNHLEEIVYLWAWVTFSNGSVLKCADPLIISFVEEGGFNTTNQQTSISTFIILLAIISITIIRKKSFGGL